MEEKTPLEINDDWKTGTICAETATYCCAMHVYIEKTVYEGNPFPQCDQKGLPHNTAWHKIVK